MLLLSAISSPSALGGAGLRGGPRARARPRVVARAGRGGESGEDYLLGAPGATAPFGFFDPLALSSGLSAAEAKRYREAELTHGRVSMLAALGWITAEKFHPLFGGRVGGDSFDAFQQVEGIWPQFWEVLLLVIGVAEAWRITRGWNDPAVGLFSLRDEYEPGDLGFDPLGLMPEDAGELQEMKTKELNNGRLAMVAVAAFAAQEAINHKGVIENLVG